MSVNVEDLLKKIREAASFSEQKVTKDFGIRFISSPTPPAYIEVLKWQHAQNVWMLEALAGAVTDLKEHACPKCYHGAEIYGECKEYRACRALAKIAGLVPKGIRE